MVNINGLMEEYIKVNGYKISSMEMECIFGPMGESMKENTKMIKNTDMEFTLGRMVKNTKANGRMENNMEKQDLQIQKIKLKLVFGIMVNM